MPGPRITIAATRKIVSTFETLENKTALRVPRHRLARLALERGLDSLACLPAATLDQTIKDDAIAGAGISAR
jgi:hypothetical protein